MYFFVFMSSKELKKVYSVRLGDSDIEALKRLADSWGLAPAEIIRLSVQSLIKAAEENKGKITLPFRQSPKAVLNESGRLKR